MSAPIVVALGGPNGAASLSQRITKLEDNETVYQIYEYVGTSASGQVTIPTESVIFDLYGDGVLDAIMVEAGAGNIPTNVNSLNSSGELVLINSLGSDGVYSLDSTPTAPACMLWFVIIRDEFKSNIPLTSIVGSGIKGVLPVFTNSTLDGDGRAETKLGIAGLDELSTSEAGQAITVKSDKSGFEYSGSISSNPIQLKAVSLVDTPIAVYPATTVVNAEVIQETNGIALSNGSITFNKAGFFRIQVQLNVNNTNNTHLDTWAEYWDGDSWEVLTDSGNHYTSINADIGLFLVESTFSVVAGTMIRLIAATDGGSATLDYQSTAGGVGIPAVTFIAYELSPIVVGLAVEPNNLTESFQIGQEFNGNATEFEPDGTMIAKGEATAWDEVSNSAVGRNIFTSVGRIDYDYDDLVVNFTPTARYPDEFMGVVSQMLHSRAAATRIRPHLHWIQNSNNNPNILIEYRTQDNGQLASAWELKALSSSDNAFPWTSIGMQQITNFNIPNAVGEGLGLSGTFECKIYRDSQNSSGLFAGPDSYSGDFSVKYYDIHFIKDMLGSRDEFIK